MRIVVIYSLVALAAVLAWLFAGRTLSLQLDRLYRTRLATTPVDALRFDNGTIEVAGVRLDTLTTQTLPSGLTALLSGGGRVSFQYQGQRFPSGPGRPLAISDFAFSPDAGDKVTFTRERGAMSWPTPFEMNFMTGSAPTWRRHQYCRLQWVKRSGARLEIVWRFKQAWFKEGGWRPATLEYGSAGLLRASITEAADLQRAAIDYLAGTRHWQPAEYRLESQGPAADGTGELMAAIHHGDESAPHPGAGRSVNLVLDYQSRRVAREIALQ